MSRLTAAQRRARLWSRIREWRPVAWLLMALAKRYDTKHPKACWADTCTDLGLGYDLAGHMEKRRDGDVPRSGCVRSAREMGSCYCGKLQANRHGDIVSVATFVTSPEERGDLDLFTEAP